MLNINKKVLYWQIFGDDKSSVNFVKTFLSMAKSVIFPMLKDAQVDSRIKEQTEVQVGCKPGKNMFY